MTYLLDADACLALINGDPRRVRTRFQRASARGETIAVSAISAFELWYGAAKSARRRENMQRLETFFAGPIDLVPFEHGDARSAGNVRAALEAAGTPIGAYDVLLAGQALHRGATLVTANASEFARVAGLAWQDWATRRR